MLSNIKGMSHSCKMSVVCVVLFFASTVFVGCLTFPVCKPLVPGFSNEKKDVKVNSNIAQDAIYIVVLETHATTFGSGLVDLVFYYAEESVHKSINKKKYKKADETIGPLQYQTQDIDFRKEFMNAFNQTISSSPWLVVKEDELDNVLNLETKYHLFKDCSTLVIETTVDFRKAAEPVYYGTLVYTSNPILNEKDEAAAVAKWAENEAVVYRDALAQGINEIMKMLRLDLLDERIPQNDSQKEKTQLTSHNLFGRTIRGKILTKDADRVIVREKKGTLFSLPYKEQT